MCVCSRGISWSSIAVYAVHALNWFVIHMPIFVRPHCSTVYVGVAYCYWRSSMVTRLVGLSVTIVGPAKMAEPIEMPFGLWTRMGPRNHVLDGGPYPRGKGQFWEGEGWPIVKYIIGNTLHLQQRCGLLWNYFDHLFSWFSFLKLLEGVLIPRKENTSAYWSWLLTAEMAFLSASQQCLITCSQLLFSRSLHLCRYCWVVQKRIFVG